jgi:DNA-binding transcriptional LysR family regulator
MEAKWLEDFVSLAETRSFSKSAALRHVTQPAFSRRIQALEAWLGADLIDRSSYPTRLTPAGETFYAQALEMLERLNATRAMLRDTQRIARDTVELAVPHTLSLTFFPGWLKNLQQRVGKLNTRLMALNVHDAAMRLAEGGCDLLMVYHHPRQPVQLDAARYDMLLMGTEALYPYSKAGRDGAPLFELPGEAERPIPFLSYTPGAYLGRMVELILADARPRLALEKCYETDMAEALKVMALEGHGVAFLPESAVVKELRARQLAVAGERWSLEMEIRLYREKPEVRHEGGRAPNPAVDALWQALVPAKTMQKKHRKMRKRH